MSDEYIIRVGLDLPRPIDAYPHPRRTTTAVGRRGKQPRLYLPPYQREYVWSPRQAASFLNAMFEGRPTGTFLMWEMRHDLPSILLDGQQRLTTLGAKLTRPDGTLNEPHPEVRFCVQRKQWVVSPKGDSFAILDTLWCDMDVMRSLVDPYLRGLLCAVHDRMWEHMSPHITLKRASLEQAAQVFRDLNGKGTQIKPRALLLRESADDLESWAQRVGEEKAAS